MTEVEALKIMCAALLAESRFYRGNTVFRKLVQRRPLRHSELLPNDEVRHVVAVMIDKDDMNLKTGEVIDNVLTELCGQPTKPLVFPLESGPKS